MTAETRFDRDLTTLLEDLYLGPSPDYRDEVMAAAVRMRQRPSWTFAGRWLPMADIVSQPAIAPHVPWRTVGLALLIIALVVGVAIVAVGARQAKVPPPFGVARNGLIAYSADGDIFTLDPVTGISTAIVTGPETDNAPVFSPDGTRIAFGRATDNSTGHPVSIFVAGADGSNPVAVTTEPIPSGPEHFGWAPDSRSILADAPGLSAVWLFDVTHPGPPKVAASNANTYLQPFQPPDGTAILIIRATDTGTQLSTIDTNTGRETVLATGGPSNDLGAAAWSPDGKQVVYNSAPAGDPDSQRLFIVNADGTGTRQITHAPGVWFDIDASWSPDGRWIAFTRYQQTSPGAFDVRPTGIYSVADGTVVEAGPLPRDVRAQAPAPSDASATRGEGFSFDWSPDGTTLIAHPSEAVGHPVLINPLGSTWRVLDSVIAPDLPIQSWQRTAP